MLPRVFALALLLLPLCPAQSWPGTQYDPAIPTFAKVLGYEPGARHPAHSEIVRYLEALAAAAPSRMKLVTYGETFEGRRLVYAAIAGAGNFRRLDQIQAANRTLADPRKSPAPDLAAHPAIVALIAAIHGNELSGPDAMLLAAYHLLAARNDAVADSVAKNAVVLIDPLQNPDGRDRFVHSFRQNEGIAADADPFAAERSEPWPGGRSNHYLFDLNRDWFALTQPESRGRVKWLQEWMPHVVADIHEMGANSTYFFAPWPAPQNPNITPSQIAQSTLFGRNNAKYFDQFGWPYFTREVFDLFFPGYGGSWPSYLGGLGMTYENAGVRGLAIRRADETLYSFGASIQKHFVASIATCETAAANRRRILDEFRATLATAVEEGRSGDVKAYVLPRRGDASAVDKLAGVLLQQGIELGRAAAPFRVGAETVPAGSYVISLAQPRKRLIRTLLDAATGMDPAFLKEQERRRAKNLSSEIYDVTAWSLPLLYNVECLASREALAVQLAPVASIEPPSAVSARRALVAYLIPWGPQASGRFLAAALRADLKLLSAGKPFTHNGRRYGSGTLIALVKQNPDSLAATVARLAAQSGAEVVAADSSWIDDGIDFGSNNTTPLARRRVALLWDAPTSSLSAGHTRFVLERQYGYPLTVLRAQALAAADLARFDTIILPDGGYAAMPGAVADRLKNWVRNGGVLVAVGGAVQYVASPAVALLPLQQESQPRPADAPKPADAAKPAPGKLIATQADYDKAVEPATELPDSQPGVLLRAKVDPETWLTAGVAETVNVLFSGRAIYAPLKSDQGTNAVRFEAPENLLAAGYLWEENRKQLAFKPFAAYSSHGDGAVVAFTADPNARAQMDGLNTLFLNAVFRYPVR